MNDDQEFTPQPEFSRLQRLLIKLGGADPETLQRCPSVETDNVTHPAVIMVLVWVLQSGIYGVVAERLFGTPGELHPELILCGVFIATLIMAFDSYVIMRAGWYSARDLKNAGRDLTGGPIERLKGGVFLCIRVLLSIGISQLFGIFLSLIVFAHDIDGPIKNEWLRINATLIAAASVPVDAEIRRETEAVTAQTTVNNSLRAQVSTLKQGEIDPFASDPQMQQAQGELNSLLSQKSEADNAVTAAQKFASDELAGLVGAQGNSGKPGSGPRRRAALEQLTNAREHQKAVSDAIGPVRRRIDDLRKQLEANGPAAKLQAHDQLPDFEQALSDGEAKLVRLQDQLAASVNGRDAAIKSTVEAAPDYVPPNDGLLNQIKVLEKIVNDDPKIYSMVLLIDLVCFGLELAAVLAKITVTIPSSYGALLVSDAYERIKRIADGIAVAETTSPNVELDSRAEPGFSLGSLFGIHPAAEPANDNPRPPSSANDNGQQPVKRGRGRPKGSKTRRANGQADPTQEGEGPKPE